MTSTSKTGASRSRQRELGVFSRENNLVQTQLLSPRFFSPSPFPPSRNSFRMQSARMTTERSPIKILHQTRRIYRICGGEDRKDSYLFESSRNSGQKREKERDKEREEFTLGVEGENGSNVRSRVKKGHGRWRKGLVNIDQSCSGTIELTIPLKSLVERAAGTNLSSPFHHFFPRSFSRFGGNIFHHFLRLHVVYSRYIRWNIFFFQRDFARIKMRAKGREGWRESSWNFLYFSRSNRIKCCCHRRRQRGELPDQCAADRLFIYLFILSLPSPRCVVTACAKKRKKEKKGTICNTTVHFSQLVNQSFRTIDFLLPSSRFFIVDPQNSLSFANRRA